MAGASNRRWLETQKSTALIERLKVLKTAWILGSGHKRQPWFNWIGTKNMLISKLQAGIAAVTAEPSVTLPVGLQDTIMTEDFNFGGCLKDFDLGSCLTTVGIDWATAKAKVHFHLHTHKLTNLKDRLKVLKTAWILGNGDMPQLWFDHTGSKEDMLEKLAHAFSAFATEPGVKLPEGLQDATMADEFDCSSCLQKFGLDWAQAQTKLAEVRAKARRGRRHWTARRRRSAFGGIVFNYNGQLYQDVNNFCDNYVGLKKRASAARKDVVKTDFPKSTYLVIPGHSKNNYRWLPTEWKDGTQDLSALKDVAYLLEKKEKPTGSRLLLVACMELKRTAAQALLSNTQRKKSAKSHHVRKRPANAP